MAGPFTQSFQRLAKKGKANLAAVTESALIQLGTAGVIATPVGDTDLWQSPASPGYKPGTLANNFFYSIGAPNGEFGRDADITASGSLSQLKQVAAVAAGNVFYLTNSTPYVKRIEFASHSTQAPAGMMRVTANNWPIYVKRAAKAVA